MIILKIIISCVLGWFWIWIGTHDGKSIYDKSLSKKEKQFLDAHELFVIIITFSILGVMWCE